MSDQSIVIVAAKRTPMGGFMGSLSAISGTQLGTYAIQALLDEKLSSHVDEVIMG
ncbi:MAG: acetyl-CoA C-acetyltransferase, partial [Paraglaciecola sp.]